MKEIINDFICSIDTKLYGKIRRSHSDASCRGYLKEHLQKQLTKTNVNQQRELLCEYTKQLKKQGTLTKEQNEIKLVDKFLST